MYSAGFKQMIRRLLERSIGPLFARLGLTPNMVTLIGLLLTLGVAVVLANGNLFLGGWLLIGASVFDLFDGALARATNQTSNFGAFFDSVIDRYSEALIFFGLLFFFHQIPNPDQSLAIGLVYASIIGSLMVSYARARAEGLAVPCETGWLGRPERMTILVAGLLFNYVLVALWMLAIFTNITAVQRIYHVWRATQQPPEPTVSGPRKRIWTFFSPEK